METSEKAKELLAIEGYDPNYGARPLRRTIERLIRKSYFGKNFWRENFVEGDCISVQNKRKKLIFTKKING